MLTTEFRMAAYLEDVVPYLFKTFFLVSVLKPTPNHIPLKFRCLGYFYVGFRHVYVRVKTYMTFSQLSSIIIIYYHYHPIHVDS